MRVALNLMDNHRISKSAKFYVFRKRSYSVSFGTTDCSRKKFKHLLGINLTITLNTVFFS